MLERVLQVPPDPTPVPPGGGGGGGGPVINIDLSGLADAIWNSFWTWLQGHIGEFGALVWGSITNALWSALRGLFLALWNATLLGIPHELTDQFAPVKAMMPDPTIIAGSGIALALALLGLRTILQGLPGRTTTGPIDELIGRITVFGAALSMLPWIVGHAIDLEQQLAQSEAITGLGVLLPEPGPPLDPLTMIALVIMAGLGVRLWFKVASNVFHVAAAIVWSPVALVCGLFPQAFWVFDVWLHEFSGRLGGAVLATIATALALGFALLHPGLLAFAAGGGGFMAAYDLVDWLAKTPGSHLGGVVGFGVRLGMGAAGSAVSGGAGTAAAAAIPANQLTTLAERYGYD